jgi:hypothetical protein
MLLLCAALWALIAPAHAMDKRLVGCLAHAIYGEARSEPIKEQLAVGWSIRFRAAADLPGYGGSDLCDVVYKVTHSRRTYKTTWQYDGAHVRLSERIALQRSLRVAKMVLSGQGRPPLPVVSFCDPRSHWKDGRDACWGHDHSGDLRQVHIGTGGHHKHYVNRQFMTIRELAAWSAAKAAARSRLASSR